MKIDARNEEFELVTVFDYPMLFTCCRVDRATVPDNLFVYDVRHDDECQGIPVEIANFVLVNHWGTLISRVPIELKENEKCRLLDEDDWSYSGETMRLDEYLNGSEYGAERTIL